MIYEVMTAPVLKEGTIVGWSEEIEGYYGRRPEPYISVLSQVATDYRSHFLEWDAFIMTGEPVSDIPIGEPVSDIPIEGLSAMLFGAILVVDNTPKWRSLVRDGVTGWLCDNEREFIYKASRCAHEVEERENMIDAARAFVLDEYADHPHIHRLIQE